MKKHTHKYLEKMEELKQLIKKLRAPDGCPWDQQQKKEDIRKYILEEAYEVVDSIDKGSPQAIKEELGDLLFQILFLTEICSESNLFSLSDVLDGIITKMIRRHPHVFGSKKVNSVQEVKENWQQIKKLERKNKNVEEDLFSGVPLSFPALKRAQKITAIASAYGFDWSKTQDVINKLKEEIKELRTAVKNSNEDEIEEELGDILFTLVNVSRFLSVDAENALSKTTEKFLRRFSYLTEQLSARGIPIKDATLAQMDALWNEAKSRV
ncbi:MAG: nucleoside triphosphate pyrophosphohydrolase [Deltaproteobacteria bacterium HGW-Deltaproteobacteria-2]|jgi:tetrapyrrole methylase family protein/MazG family protein|nr:MAG: nucleoside triphosphate pyrophosphohydrolase [Deltaproteobacteria bacterium HGW-Deltaproteobacteria-2]